MLLIEPESSYEVEIGQTTPLDLGKFQGNAIDIVFVFYEVLEASDPSLKDDFEIDHTYDKGLLSLNIDLTKVDPRLAGSKVEGELAIWNMDNENKTYAIDFSLICTNKD